METNRRNEEENRSRETGHQSAAKSGDLPDSPHDAERLKAEETIIDLPDVKDIPGQEFVHTAPLAMLADTTISSADEEGDGIFDDDTTDDDVIPGVEGDTSTGQP